MNKLNTELKNQAIALGMCAQWQKDWNEDWDVDKMAEMMFKGLNFCSKYHYPSKDFLISHFDRSILRSKNIVADDRYSLLNPEKALITGNSESTVRYNGISSGVIHIQDTSSVKVSAKNRSFVIIHLFDKAQVTVEKEDLAKVFVVRHSPDTILNADKDIKYKNRF